MWSYFLAQYDYRHLSGVEPSPCFGWKRHLESRLYVRPKRVEMAGYKRQRDIDSLCRESAGAALEDKLPCVFGSAKPEKKTFDAIARQHVHECELPVVFDTKRL